MSLSFINSIFRRLFSREPLMFYAATWTTILTLTVAVASFWPEFAFVSAISPTSSFSQACHREGYLRLPLDIPGENLCFPVQLFSRSKMDVVVPPVFAAVIVTSTAYAVRALGLWEGDDDQLL
ncbi:unnamed protein product [Fraxinus pennsylvanica]|uniref:Uncharacterized protein n=1 Tax=Fraxinus pennsylvanica TaxID=56036 RepID=A0AAD1ZF43_9LAMI|nr:unnamed protein product [Fraxinus pennsylvanica]